MTLSELENCAELMEMMNRRVPATVEVAGDLYEAVWFGLRAAEIARQALNGPETPLLSEGLRVILNETLPPGAFVVRDQRGGIMEVRMPAAPGDLFPIDESPRR